MSKQRLFLSLCLIGLFLLSMAPARAAKGDHEKLSQAGLYPSANGAKVGFTEPEVHARLYASYTGRKYRLGPNDIISISVYDNPEFTQEKILIQPDGNITMTPFGSIQLAGMTIEEVQQLMIEKLKFYLNDPQVSIKLENTKPFTVYVSGAVVKPGAYEMVTDVFRNQQLVDNIPEVLVERKTPLLSNILVAAGGIAPDADLEHVKIVNSIDGSSTEVNLLQLITEGDSSQDVYLIAGDSVQVPRLPTAYALSDEHYKTLLGSTIFQRNIPVKVYGYVNNPGLVRLESAQSANLNSAIVAAGGYSLTTPYAPKKVFVSRVDSNGRIATTTVDPRREDMALRPNDIVYVPDKMRPKVGRAFDYVTRLIAPASTFANGYNNWAFMFDPTRSVVNFNAR